jgi:citrate synthase
MTSALTYIDGERHFYRGLDAVELARSGRSLEDVATWLWTGSFDHDEPAAAWRCPEPTRSAVAAAQAALPPVALPLDRLRVAVAVASVSDSLRYDTSPAAVRSASRSLMACLVDSLPLLADDGQAAAGDADLAARLWPRVSPLVPAVDRVRLLRTALVLLADHELAVSTVAVRLAASTGAHIYAVVSAGLGTLDGPRHGGASLAAESVIAEVAGGKDAAQAIGERLRRGERIPGFGQPLYPGGDPRAVALLDLLREMAGEGAVRPVHELGAVMQDRGLPAANVDLALAALGHTTQMTTGAGEVIFSVARTAGWVAHALEEYAEPTYHRPRAVYTGPDPSEARRAGAASEVVEVASDHAR